MPDREKVIRGLECHYSAFGCPECPYWNSKTRHNNCHSDQLFLDALALLREQEDERNRLISWMSKFCQHIENLDRPLPDAENLEFFKEKMAQQFGWEVSGDD